MAVLLVLAIIASASAFTCLTTSLPARSCAAAREHPAMRIGKKRTKDEVDVSAAAASVKDFLQEEVQRKPLPDDATLSMALKAMADDAGAWATKEAEKVPGKLTRWAQVEQERLKVEAATAADEFVDYVKGTPDRMKAKAAEAADDFAEYVKGTPDRVKAEAAEAADRMKEEAAVAADEFVEYVKETPARVKAEATEALVEMREEMQATPGRLKAEASMKLEQWEDELKLTIKEAKEEAEAMPGKLQARAQRKVGDAKAQVQLKADQVGAWFGIDSR